jgi:hypothetical protein
MECLIIRLTEEETWAWRRGDEGSELLRKDIRAIAKVLSRKNGVRVEIESTPEENPDYLEARPTTLWSSAER